MSKLNKITITIPDDLTPSEEILAISEQLGRKLLPKDNGMTIGDGYAVEHLETHITVFREPIGKPIVIRTCSICKTDFQQQTGKTLWLNYGGRSRKSFYCSNSCREFVLNMCGCYRAAIKKKELGKILK